MIRKIRPEDAPALVPICSKELGRETTASYLRQRILELSGDTRYCLAVFEDDTTHEVLGFLQAEGYNLLYGGNGWNVIALAVSEKAQHRGIGRQLLTSLEKMAEGQGCSFVRLNCNVIRTGAHAFYQHMGYTCDKTQKRFIKSIGPQS